MSSTAHPLPRRLLLLAVLSAAMTSSRHGLAAAQDHAALDEAILTDILTKYSTYDAEPSTCTSQASMDATSFSFDWPGTDPNSEWSTAPDFTPFEEAMFQAIMNHTDATGDRSWSVRM